MDFETAIVPGLSAPPPGKSNLQQFEEASFHRWYNFILGFSDQLVGPLLDKLNIGPQHIVLDPFCGTGTTLIECAKRQIPSIGIDANPFAVFAARVKADFDLDPDALIRAMRRVEERYRYLVSTNRRFTSGATYDYLEKSGMLSRGWISKRPLRKALVLRDAIRRGRDSALTDVMMLALVADLPSNIGNMKFGPQIYRGPIKEDVDPLPQFRARVNAIADDLRSYAASRETYADPKILLGDARSLKPSLRHTYGSNIPAIDYVICSPPYPTEHDYTRHTRLELAFDLPPLKWSSLKYVLTMEDEINGEEAAYS